MSFTGLNYLDYFVIAVMCLSTLFAFIRGFLGSFLSLAGWIASILLTYIAFPYIEPILASKIKSQIIVIIAGHAGLLIGFLIAFGMINLFATFAVKGLTTGIIDRSLGAFFGVMRGAMIVSFLFLIAFTSISIFNGIDDDKKAEEQLPKWLADAKTYPYLKDGSEMLASFIPDSFYDRLSKMYEEVTRKSADERYLENGVAKLKKALTPSEISDIEAKAKEESLVHSSDEVKYSKMESILKTYEDKHMSHKSPKQTDKGEVSKLKSLLDAKKVELTSDSTESE